MATIDDISTQMAEILERQDEIVALVGSIPGTGGALRGDLDTSGHAITTLADPDNGVSGDLPVTPEGDLLLDPGGVVVTEKLVVPRIRFVEIVENATLSGPVPHMIVVDADADIVLELDPIAADPEDGLYAYVQVVNGRAATAAINPLDDGGTINGSTSAYTLTGFAAKTLIHHGAGAWQVL